MQHAQRHGIFTSKLHRTNLQHLGAQTRHLQHLFKGDAIESASALNHARVSGIDTIYVSVDLTLVGLQRCCQRHTGGVGAATAKGGNGAILVSPLEARHDNHTTGSQLAAHTLVVNLLDTRLTVGTVGQNTYLRARHGDSLNTDSLERHGQQADGDLLASGDDHVHLARIGVGLNLLGQINQAVGFPAHGGDHHDQVITPLPEALDFLGYLLDSLHAANRGTTKLLDNKRHFATSILTQRSAFRPV